jgi:hypothetical protein
MHNSTPTKAKGTGTRPQTQALFQENGSMIGELDLEMRGASGL